MLLDSHQTTKERVWLLYKEHQEVSLDKIIMSIITCDTYMYFVVQLDYYEIMGVAQKVVFNYNGSAFPVAVVLLITIQVSWKLSQ